MITSEQRSAASYYWTKILTGELIPEKLKQEKKGQAIFMVAMEKMHREALLEELQKQNPMWPLEFMNSLDSLLTDVDESSVVLNLNYRPEGLLEQAAKKAGVPNGLFPAARLTMKFDSKNHLIVGDEEIDAQAYAKAAVDELVLEFKTTK